MKYDRISFISIAGVFAIVFSAINSANAIVRPRPTDPSTEENVVKPVIKKAVGGQAPQQYDTAKQVPAARPNYDKERVYENPVVHKLEFGEMRALNDLQGWLPNAGAADGRRGQ